MYPLSRVKLYNRKLWPIHHSHFLTGWTRSRSQKLDHVMERQCDRKHAEEVPYHCSKAEIDRWRITGSGSSFCLEWFTAKESRFKDSRSSGIHPILSLKKQCEPFFMTESNVAQNWSFLSTSRQQRASSPETESRVSFKSKHNWWVRSQRSQNKFLFSNTLSMIVGSYFHKDDCPNLSSYSPSLFAQTVG